MSEEIRNQKHITRRVFLGALTGTAAHAGTILYGTGFLAQPRSRADEGSGAAGSKHSHLVDVHHHYVTPEYIAEVHPKSPLSAPIRMWSLEETLADMEKTGTATAILSISSPGLWFGDPVATRKIARICNEYAARVIKDNPKRFGAFAAMPLPDTDASLKEIEYSLDVLKLDGIGLMTNYAGKYLGDPSFAPVFAELNRRKAIVYTHPITCPFCKELVPEIAPHVIEFSADTTRSIASVVFSGTANRNPDVRWIWSHAGGAMPFLIGRFQDASKEPANAKRLPNGLMYELRRFYYDTAQSVNPVTMTALAKVIPLSQVVFGTDFPFREGAGQVAGLYNCSFTPQEMQGIERDNVLRLMPSRKS